MPNNLKRTWAYTGSIKDDGVQYAHIYTSGKSLEEACPEELKDEFLESQKN